MIRHCMSRAYMPLLSLYKPQLSLLSIGHPRLHSASFSTAIEQRDSSHSDAYIRTISNLKIGSHTRVIFQGFTGRQATFDAKQSLEYGTQIVGGVKPGQEGEHLGLPVLPSVRAAMTKLKPDATAVYVAAGQARGAIEEAIEAEVPLIVAVAEHIPPHDLLWIHQMLRTQSKSRLLGPNTPGMINPRARCRIGFHPILFFSAGSVGIVAKSGTLSYETVASTTRAGVGQSLVIGIGGDSFPGSDFVDALKIFEHDEATKGIIMIGEIGGHAEQQAAKWIEGYKERTSRPKPIMGLVAGLQAVGRRIMGHTGAVYGDYSGSARAKINSLVEAGVVMTDHPAKFGQAMRSLLVPELKLGSETGVKKPHPRGLFATNSGIPKRFGSSQNRSICTIAHPMTSTILGSDLVIATRGLYVNGNQALDLLHNWGIPTTARRRIPNQSISNYSDFFRIKFNLSRQVFMPYVTIERGSTRHILHENYEELLFRMDEPADEVDRRIQVLCRRDWGSFGPTGAFPKIICSLRRMFMEKEGRVFTVRVAELMPNILSAFDANLKFTDEPYRIAGRHQDIHAHRDVTAGLVPEEVEAAKEGIVYHKLEGNGGIGILVNGAGLAMNTNDALHARGGLCANFLDTGGKATRETVKASFRVLLKDPRVNTIFVNIFGCLTRCDMIAEGIILAYKELGINLPVVVRLRGTNETVGQKMIADSGLPLHAYDDFEVAARKVIQLAKEG